MSAGGSYSVNGGAFVTGASTINPGQTVAVRQTSSGSNSTTTTVTLTIGGVAGTFSVTTQAPPPPPGTDLTPNPFSFTPLTGVPLISVVTSGAIIPTGYDGPVGDSVTAGGSYSINGGPLVTVPGSIGPGQTVAVRLTSASSNSTQTCATLTIGGVAGSFCVTTVGAGTPTAPTAVSATAGNSAITVKFGPPVGALVSPTTGYTATCTSSNGGVTRSNSGGATATSIQVSGLTNGKSYTCTVRASNAAGAV